MTAPDPESIPSTALRPVLTVFSESPDEGRGMARDMRVRWALEEVGQPYDTRLVTFAEMKQPAHLARQPFGQIPSYEAPDGMVLFESGAIVLHLAERHAGLLPVDSAARSRAIAWLFAAVSTVEPPIVEWESAHLMERGQPWHAQRVPMMEDRIRARLESLAAGADWLDGDFSVGDLMTAEALYRLDGSPLLDAYPTLTAYLTRAHARPAYQRAFAAQLAVFEASRG